MSKIKKSELLDIVREQGSAITNLLQRVTLLEKPQRKQLDQSVFPLIERESVELTGSDLCRAMLARGDKCVLIRMGVRDDKQAKDIGRFAIATSIDGSGRFNVMSDQQPISKVNFAVPINNQGEPLTQAEAGL